MNRDLTVALYQAVNDAPADERSNLWHASSIAKCPRSLYLGRQGVPGLEDNEPGAGKKLRWAAGHAIEATIRPYLLANFPGAATNLRFTNERLALTGEFDGYDRATRQLFSVKSVHDYAFITKDGQSGLKEAIGNKVSPRTGREVVEWGLKSDPYIHHLWQEHAYSLLLAQPDTLLDDATGTSTINPEDYPVQWLTFIYITLGGQMACYTTEVDKSILSRLERKVAYLNESWGTQTAPLCLCQPDKEMYRVTDQYCPYKTAEGCCEEAARA